MAAADPKPDANNADTMQANSQRAEDLLLPLHSAAWQPRVFAAHIHMPRVYGIGSECDVGKRPKCELDHTQCETSSDQIVQHHAQRRMQTIRP